ncbi:hypothetical protein GQ54DRAFT_296688 [Martensiomyces pterosporus]|nr:hypothetical protein GQ54DRAFT_296688 [Martensiomyces pterosporus]
MPATQKNKQRAATKLLPRSTKAGSYSVSPDTSTASEPFSASTAANGVEPFIVKSEPAFDSAITAADLQEYSQQLSEALAAAVSVSPEGVFATGNSPIPGGGSLSPAWSMSSGSNNSGEYNSGAVPPMMPHSATHSPIDDGASDPLAAAQEWLATSSQELMFPHLASSALGFSATSAASSLDATGSTAIDAATQPANTADAAALDGWLQQFVNADAMDAITSERPRAASTDAVAPFSAATTSTTTNGAHRLSPVPDFTFSSPSVLPITSIAATSVSSAPVSLHSKSHSPSSSGIDLFDSSTVAAMASAAAAAAAAATNTDITGSSTLSQDVLVSMLSSAAGFCAPNPQGAGTQTANGASADESTLLSSAASEISMLTALPFTNLAMPMANIAPQKTLSLISPIASEFSLDSSSLPSSSPSASPPPPSKRQRRPASSRKSPSPPVGLKPSDGGHASQAVEVAGINSRAQSLARNRSSKPDAASSSSGVVATAVVANSAKPQTASPSPPPTRRPLAPSPPRSSTNASTNGVRHMVALAPRQPQGGASTSANSVPTVAANSTAGANGSSSQPASRSGSNTPPGLSVLAKMAQKQSPIQVKSEQKHLGATSIAPAPAATQQPLRRIVQAHSPTANRQQPQGRTLAPNGNASAANGAATAHSPSPAPQAIAAPAPAPAAQLAPSSADSVVQKRQERLIKNRAAALLSRKRKREYLTKLESEVEDLRESNTSLARRLAEMESRLNALAVERDELRRENESVRAAAAASASTATATSSSSSATATNTSGRSSSGKQQEANSAEPSSAQQTKSESNGSGTQASDAMEVDGSPISTTQQSAVPLLSGAAAKATANSSRASSVGPRSIKPRVTLPIGAPKAQQHQQQHGPSSTSSINRQRTASALLMAVFFSFSLFTLPSLYTSDNQITTGGSQSAGILPIRALPPTEPRLLISGSDKEKREPASGHGSSASASDSPLIERVRRSISALTQHMEDGNGQVPPASSNSSNSSNSGGEGTRTGADKSEAGSIRMRPMTMEESAGLHAWIKKGLARQHVPLNGPFAGDLSLASAGLPSENARRHAEFGSPPNAAGSSSLSIIPRQGSQAGGVVGQQLDYAMLYCPSVQHVLFGGDMNMDELRGFDGSEVYKPSAVRVIRAGSSKHQGSAAHMDKTNDVDDTLLSEIALRGPSSYVVPEGEPDVMNSAAVGDGSKMTSDLIPTQAGGSGAALLRRPRMSFYSPVVVDGVPDGENLAVLPPWEEYAKMAARNNGKHHGALGSRQKYLRIDVEVVGSRWVTADKFANGLY